MFIGEVLLPSDPLQGPPLESFQQTHVLLMLRDLELEITTESVQHFCVGGSAWVPDWSHLGQQEPAKKKLCTSSSGEVGTLHQQNPDSLDHIGTPTLPWGALAGWLWSCLSICGWRALMQGLLYLDPGNKSKEGADRTVLPHRNSTEWGENIFVVLMVVRRAIGTAQWRDRNSEKQCCYYTVSYIYIFMYAYIFKNSIKAVTLTGLLLKKNTLKRFTVQMETCVWILLQQISEQEVSHYM